MATRITHPGLIDLREVRTLNNDGSYTYYPNVDYMYGPYTATTEKSAKEVAFEALSATTDNIEANALVKGKTVGIIEDGKVVEYWFESDPADAATGYQVTDLVKKTNQQSNVNELFGQLLFKNLEVGQQVDMHVFEYLKDDELGQAYPFSEMTTVQIDEVQDDYNRTLTKIQSVFVTPPAYTYQDGSFGDKYSGDVFVFQMEYYFSWEDYSVSLKTPWTYVAKYAGHDDEYADDGVTLIPTGFKQAYPQLADALGWCKINIQN